MTDTLARPMLHALRPRRPEAAAALTGGALALAVTATVVGAGLLASAKPAAAQSPDAAEAAAPRIPLETLFANPVVRHPRLSPEGSRLAWLADVDGGMNIRVRRLAGGEVRTVTSEDGGVDAFSWTPDGRTILFLKDDRGDRRYALYAVDVAAGDSRAVARFEDATVQLLGVLPSEPDRALLSMNLEDPTRFDVYRVDLDTGELTLEIRNPGFLGSPSDPSNTWHLDGDLHVRTAFGGRNDGGTDLYALRGDRWERLATWSLEEGEPRVVAADADGVWILDARDANTTRLVRLDGSGRVGEPVAADPVYDVDEVLVGRGGRPLAAAIYRDRRVWTPLDPSVAADVERLSAACSGDISIVSRTADDARWVARCSPSDSPGSFLLLDRGPGTVEELFRRSPALERYVLLPKEPFSFETRDGLTVHGYLTRPTRAEGRRPAVVMVHGGPWARDRAGFDPTVQWLANRGYLVLQVNFRGSTGYGRRFAAAGVREMGRKMQDDLTDAVRWASARGLIDPDRVAIMGGSYGGYAALAGLAFTPELYRAGISIVGFGNLLTLLERVAPMFSSSIDLYHNFIGDPATEAALLRERSPFFHVDRIRAPALLAHGRRDPLVPVEESRAMARSLEARGVPTILVEWPDEGHGLTHPANRLAFYRLAERFLACHVLDEPDACPSGAGM